MKIAAIIQARMGSTRLPGKNMLDLCGKTVLSRVIERTKGATSVDEICVATTVGKRDDVIVQEAVKNKVSVFRGAEDDVMDRYLQAAKEVKADCIVRVTADNPLTEPAYIDKCALSILSGKYDFAAMVKIPYGSNAEAVSTKSLRAIYPLAKKYDKEHVTSCFYKKEEEYNVRKILPEDYERRPDIRITLDTEADYIVLKDIFKYFKNTETSGIKLKDVIEYLDCTKIGQKEENK